jgi:hypothetical protein
MEVSGKMDENGVHDDILLGPGLGLQGDKKYKKISHLLSQLRSTFFQEKKSCLVSPCCYHHAGITMLVSCSPAPTNKKSLPFSQSQAMADG